MGVGRAQGWERGGQSGPPKEGRGGGLLTMLVLDPPWWEAVPSSLNGPKLRGAEGSTFSLCPKLNPEVTCPGDPKLTGFLVMQWKKGPSLGPSPSVLCTLLSKVLRGLLLTHPPSWMHTCLTSYQLQVQPVPCGMTKAMTSGLWTWLFRKFAFCR